MNNTTAQTQNNPKKQRDGLRVLLWFVGFFLVCCSVNAVFVFKALNTHPGTVVENPYQEGLHYNDLLEKAKKLHDAKNTQHPTN